MDIFGGSLSSTLSKQNSLQINRLNMNDKQLKLHSNIIVANCTKIDTLFTKTTEIENRITTLEDLNIQNYMAENQKKTMVSIEEIHISLKNCIEELRALQKVIAALNSRVNSVEVFITDKQNK